MHFLQNSQRERAEIKNLHSHICINVISSSGRFALSPALVRSSNGVNCVTDTKLLKLTTDTNTKEMAEHKPHLVIINTFIIILMKITIIISRLVPPPSQFYVGQNLYHKLLQDHSQANLQASLSSLL